MAENPKVCAAYGRQLPRQDCSFVEKYTRSFNYPETSSVKTAEDIQRLGIKTFFCSDVCAAYKRDIFDRLGGYVDHAIFNEDMIYAAKAVEAGSASYSPPHRLSIMTAGLRPPGHIANCAMKVSWVMSAVRVAAVASV